jgi:phenylacetate-CoA ligase
VGATGGHFASFVTVERLRRLQPWLSSSMQSFSILQPVEDLVVSLNAFAPSVIATYPTVAALLAEEAVGGRLRLNLDEVWTGGETLSAVTRQRVESVLGCKVRNNYGSSEFLSMGWECSHGKLHLNTDWCVLEPVDEQFRPVPAGEASCSVLLTNLANKVQPLIRYDLGDQVTLDPEPCACGSTLPVFEVQGRRDDTLRVPGRHGHAVHLLPLALSTVLEEEAGVFEFQIQEMPDGQVVLRLPQAGEAGRGAMVRARAALKRYADSQGALPIRVKGEVGKAIPRGRSGKACRIVRYKA